MPDSPYARKPWLKHYDFWVPPDVTYPRQSLYQILMIAVSQYRDRPATAFQGAKLTFLDIKNRADRLATSFARMGIRKGDRVGIMLPNCPQYPIAYFAILRLGAIVVNVNPGFTPREIGITAVDSGMRAILTVDSNVGAVQTAQPATSIEVIVSTTLAEYSAGGSPAAPPQGTLSMADLIGVEVDLPRVEIDAENDLALLQYTGGTTGTPKGAMLTHFNLYANMLQAALWGSYFTQKGNERGLLVIPYYHIYGQTIGLLLGAWNGSMQILIPKFDIELLIAAFREHEPTYFPGVPTLFISLLNHEGAKTCGLDKVRGFGSGSAPLPVEIIERFEQLSGAMLREGYGLTEISCSGCSTPALGRRKPGSVGLPLTGTEFRIVDAATGEEEAPAGEEGELCIRGPQVMKGYWNKPEETANAIRKGWFYTGDIARMDEDGYFYIVQRKKDMIIVSGFNVFPTEVEEVLFTHPAVLEAAVIGVPHDYRGEAVKAFVVLREGMQTTAEELLDYCRARLAKYKLPSHVEFSPSLPKSGVGKVLRRELRDSEERKRKS